MVCNTTHVYYIVSVREGGLKIGDRAGEFQPVISSSSAQKDLRTDINTQIMSLADGAQSTSHGSEWQYDKGGGDWCSVDTSQKMARSR